MFFLLGYFFAERNIDCWLCPLFSASFFLPAFRKTLLLLLPILADDIA